MKHSRPVAALSGIGFMACLLACFLGRTPFVQAEERIINMAVGEQTTKSVPGVTTVSVGNRRVADVKILGPDSFLLFATGPGRTTLLVLREGQSSLSFTINVSKDDVENLRSEIAKVLGPIEGVSIRSVGERVVADGKTFTTADYNRVLQICGMYPGLINLVQINPNAKKLMADQLNVEFQNSGLKDIEATVIGTRIFLEGSVESKADLQKAELIVKALNEQVENLLAIGIKRMVLVEVEFVVIKKTGLDNLGIRWPLALSGTGSAQMTSTINLENNARTNLFFGTVEATSQFGLGFLVQDGYARVLAQPKLVCASGEKAEFMAGGEVPIPLITQNQMTVEFKPFGVILNITPNADRHGNIQTEIHAEVSDIDPSLGIKNSGFEIPGFSVDRAKTNVTVHHGQTIVLSGLFHHAQGKGVAKLPGLGHIPIIGELFKSRDFREKKEDLVVFVTPTIVNPDTEKVRNIIQDARERYKRAKDQVTFGIFD